MKADCYYIVYTAFFYTLLVGIRQAGKCVLKYAGQHADMQQRYKLCS